MRVFTKASQSLAAPLVAVFLNSACVPVTELVEATENRSAGGTSGIEETEHERAGRTGGGSAGKTVTAIGDATSHAGSPGSSMGGTGGAPSASGTAGVGGHPGGTSGGSTAGSSGEAGTAGEAGASGGSGLGAKTRHLFLPGPEGKDAVILSGDDQALANTNFANLKSLEASAWPRASQTVLARALIDFDWSQLPEDAVIESADISFTYAACSPDEDQLEADVWTGLAIQRVVEPWSESEVTWNSQPATTSQDQVTFSVKQPSDVSNPGGFGHVITSMVQSCFADRAHCHGFMVRLIDESPLQRICFHSSDGDVELRRPWFTVYYRRPVP